MLFIILLVVLPFPNLTPQSLTTQNIMANPYKLDLPGEDANSTLLVQVPTFSSSTSTTSPSFNQTFGSRPMMTPAGLGESAWSLDKEALTISTHVPVKIRSPGISVMP